MASLREAVSKRFLVDILDSVTKQRQWVVLILDKSSTAILTSSFKVSDVLSRNVMVLENLDRERKDLPNEDAIYLVAPDENSINRITGDFSVRPKYKAVHIFFLEACPDYLFKKISACKLLASRIKTLKEVDLAFIPYESKVFSLDYPKALNDFYAGRNLEKMADHLVTVCSMMEEYPHVRYRSGVRRVEEFAHVVQQRLDQYKADNPSLGAGRGKDKSELIILDRGFDVTSPLVHEITYQAMVYDVLNIDKDVYKFKQQSMAGSKVREVTLNEQDKIWTELRHSPINVVAERIQKDFDEFLKKRKMMKAAMSRSTAEAAEVKDMSRLLKEYPQYQRSLNEHSLHVSLAQECNEKLGDKGGVVHLCGVEQDLVMKVDSKGEALKNASALVYDILFPKSKGEASPENTYSHLDKFRVLALYILYNNGVPNDDFRKFSEYANLPKELRQALLNLQHLGVTILREQKRKSGPSLKRVERRIEDMYTIARWVPVVKDIVEYAMDRRLDDSYCPFLKDRSRSSMGSSASGGPRTTVESVKWDWRGGTSQSKQEARQQSEGSLIIFIVGGVTYSEIRSIYEVAKTKTNREIYIGGTSILTPKSFIEMLRDMPSS